MSMKRQEAPFNGMPRTI